MAANNIYIQVDYNSKDAQANVNALNDALAKTGPAAEKSSAAATKSVQSVGVTIKQVNSEFQTMAQAIAGLGIARMFTSMAQSANELNRVILAMQSFTGSAEEAKKVFEDVRAIAAQSPFRMKDLEETARQMLGFGFAAKNIPNILKGVTDQVARMGGSMEDVSGIVTLFGRMMEKNFVGAMDVLRKLPSEGIPVLKQLAKEMQETLGHPVSVDDARNAIKAGLIDPLQMVRITLDALKQSGGFGAMIADFTQKMKVLGDTVDELKRRFMSDEGFGKAFKMLADEIGNVLGVFAGFVDYLMKLPEPTKELIVNLTAAAVAIAGLGTALNIVIALGGPLMGFVKTLATFGVTVALMNPEVTALVAAIGALGAALYVTIPAFREFVNSWGDKLKGVFTGLAEKGKAFAADLMKGIGEGIEKGPPIDLGSTWFTKAYPEIVKFSDEANKVLMNALQSPVEAVAVKYAEMFSVLEKRLGQKGDLFAMPDVQKDAMRTALRDARATELRAAQLKEDQKLREEATKAEVEHVKAAYQGQIDYIEAMDEQDLRKKVAAIDQITDLRIASAHKVADVENAALAQANTEAQQAVKDHRDELERAHVDVAAMLARMDAETVKKQQANTQKATDEEQQIRLQGWKKANDAIIEDQKRIFESFKSLFDQMFDALTGKNVGKAMGDFFKKFAMEQMKDLFSSQAAAIATTAAGYGYPQGGITRGSGILSQLLQHGMAPRPPGPPPESYNPAAADSVVKPLEDGANRLNLSATLYNDATVRFALAVGQFASAGGGGGGSSQGYAERMDTRGDVGSAITRASVATGVPESLLRAVAQTESHMDPSLTSRKGAQGLFQLMPPTQQDWGVTNPFDPGQSAMGGAQQLKRLLAHYGGNVPLALAAYNWGPGNVDKAIAHGGAFPEETQKYVKKITALLASSQGGADTGGTGGADDFAGAGGRSGGGGASGSWGPMPQFQYPPGVLLPAGDMGGEPPTAMPTFQPPGFQLPAAWSIPQLTQSDIDKYSTTAGATPATIQRAKQAGLLGILLGGGKGGTATAGFGGLDLSKLKELFGIGTATTIWGPNTGTTLQSVLTSKGMGMIASMGGMMLFSQGMQKRSPLLTSLGGGLAGVGAIMTDPKMMAQLAAGPGGLAAGLGAGAAAGVGLGLYASGLQRGGGTGLAMDIGGGALAGAGIGFLAGGPMGAAIGAAIGAGVGLISGVVRLFVQTEQEKIRAQIKQVYGIDISNRQILGQIQQIVDQNYGGNVAVGIRSQEVQNLVRLYALSTGQAANMPRPMYAATIAQSTGGLQLQPVYQGGQQVQNPYTGVTTYQYQTATAAAQGLMPNPGSGLGVPGGAGLVNWQFAQLNTQTVLSTIQNNPAAITMASASGATAGDSRLSTTQAMQEPLTLLA